MSCFLSYPLLLSYMLSEREFYVSGLGCFVCGCGPWLSSRRRWKKKAILIHTGQGCARQCNDQYRGGSMDSRALQTKVLSAQFLPKPSPSFLGEVIWCPFLCCWKSILNKWAKNLNRTHYSCREHGTVGVGGSARFLMRQNTLKCNKNKE